MKKIVSLLILVLIVFGGTACIKQESGEGMVLSKSVIKEGVKGWTVYTNPAYRYEFRLPKDWTWLDSGEDGKLVQLFEANNTTTSVITINSVSNWQEGSSLEDYYKNQPENLWVDSYERQEVKIAGQTAYWIKVINDEEIEKEVVVWNLQDSIVEFVIKSNTETARIILNSLNFYGNKTISDLN